MRFISNFIYMFVLVANAVTIESIDSELYRDKRQINSLPLVFPYGSVYKFIIGVAAPISNPDEVKMDFAVNFQYQYSQFTNISELSQYYFIKEIKRDQRDTGLGSRRDERLVFYRALANLLESKGLNGVECVLRAICETAQFPVGEEGLVGEIIHILLTPDYGKSPFEDGDSEWDNPISIYREAALAGRRMFICQSVYPGCPEDQGVMDLFTILRDE